LIDFHSFRASFLSRFRVLNWVADAQRSALIASLAVAAGVALVVVALLGAHRSPIDALNALVTGSVGSPASLSDSAAQAIPLLFTGLSVTMAFRCGIWNIGAEGQFLTGMLAAAAVALRTGGWPGPGTMVAALAAGMAAGAGWAAVPAALRTFRGAPEVITTLMCNFIAAYLLSYCVQGPLHERGTDIPRTPLMPRQGWLPTLIRGSDVHAGLIVALLAGAGVYLLFSRTALGLRIRAVGLGPEAARSAGVPARRVAAITFLSSGALAGLGGAAHSLGMVHQLFIYQPGEPGFGYTGIAVALLGGQNAIGVVAAAALFGALAAGSSAMQREAGVSFQMAYAIQALAIFAFLAARARR
jgi:simple sugar transport system permease protein